MENTSYESLKLQQERMEEAKKSSEYFKSLHENLKFNKQVDNDYDKHFKTNEGLMLLKPEPIKRNLSSILNDLQSNHEKEKQLLGELKNLFGK